MDRDIQLDIYRAIVMMHIVCIIHLVTFLHFYFEPFMSIVLFEMPAIFFIAGASMSYQKRRKGIGEMIRNRFERVVIPYFIYVFVMLVLLVLLSFIWHFFYPQVESLKDGYFTRKFTFDITEYTWYDVLQIIRCEDIPQSPYVYHLWFIPVYLILTCTFPIQTILMQKVNRWIYIAISIALFIMVVLFTDNCFVRNVFCYNVFLVAGYLFYKKLDLRHIYLIGASALVVVLIYLYQLGDFIPMHSHKFPADLLFLSYNIVVLCLFSLIFGRVRLPNLRIFQIWNKHGYSIYLYHSFILFFVFIFLVLLFQRFEDRFVQLICCIPLMFVLSTAFSFLTYKLEYKVLSVYKGLNL